MIELKTVRDTRTTNGNTISVLLLQPWIEDFYTTDCRIQPIGLAYLAGSLKQRFADIDVRIYDALAGGKRRTVPLPNEFSYLKRYYGVPDSGPFSLFHHYYRFGKSTSDIINDLTGSEPFLIGISSLFTPYYRQSLEFAHLCRRLFPGVPIVMGGSHATMHPHTLLRPYKGTRVCDYVITGEAEEPICELIEMLLQQRTIDTVSNLVTPDETDNDNDTRRHHALSPPIATRIMSPSQVHPDFAGLNPDDYTYSGKRMSFLITSRSCPHRCTFCSIHSVFGYTYRVRPADDIVAEIQARYAQGIRHFDIEDDNFTVNKNEIVRLLDTIVELGLPITFSAMNGLSYISLDERLLTKMRAAGFSTLNLALVSSDQLVLKASNRPHTVKKYDEIIAIASRLNFRVTAYFILGMPHQEIADMWGTLKMLAGSQCLVGASPFYFTPGSPIHRLEAKNPTITLASDTGGDAYFSARLTAMDLETDRFSRDDIYTLFRMTRLINYSKKGLDDGHEIASPYFERVATILREHRWYADNKIDRHELPFSDAVAALIDAEPFTLCGYRSPRLIRWDPRHSHFHECHPNPQQPNSQSLLKNEMVQSPG